jgi:tetratricopeptide (TPR) repeat protein
MADPKKQAIADQLFATGQAAVKTQNWDYAIDSFLKCVKFVPEKLIYRVALRQACQKKYVDNKKGAPMAGMKMAPARARAGLARTRGKWLDLLEAAEDALTINPWDFSSLYDVASGAYELNFLEVGLAAVQDAIRANAQSADAYRVYGRLLEKANQFAKASQAWEMVHKLDPRDGDAQTKAHQLAASATIQKGGYEEQDDTRKLSQTIGNETIVATASVGDSIEARAKRELDIIEAKLKADPNSVSVLIQLGDYHRKNEDFEKAAGLYDKAVSLSPGDNPDLRLRLFDCRIEPWKRKRDQVQAAVNGLDKSAADAREKFAKLKAQFDQARSEILKREIELYKYRTGYRADDAEAWFELGTRLSLAGQVDEAIAALQKSRADIRFKAQAHLALGRAFRKKKNPALAEKNLTDALDSAPTGNEDFRKEILYEIGCLAEEKQDKPRAIDLFNEIAAIDYGYKDVAKRLDALNASD